MIGSAPARDGLAGFDDGLDVSAAVSTSASGLLPPSRLDKRRLKREPIPFDLESLADLVRRSAEGESSVAALAKALLASAMIFGEAIGTAGMLMGPDTSWGDEIDCLRTDFFRNRRGGEAPVSCCFKAFVASVA